MLIEFNRFDVTLPEDLATRLSDYVDASRASELLDDADIPLQIAHARHRHPKQSEAPPISHTAIRIDIEACLDAVPASVRTDLMIGTLTTGAHKALHRVATSLARDDGSIRVTEQHWRQSRSLLMANLEALVARADVRNLSRQVKREEEWRNSRKRDVRYDLVRNALAEAPMGYLDLWDRLGNTSAFPTPEALADFLQKLRENHLVHFDQKKNYNWSA